MKIYYLDDEHNIYDENSSLIGKVGVNGFFIDENNNLIYNGNIVGVIGGNLTDLNQTNDINKSSSNIKKLRKNNNAGFGQIMIVSLVLICLILFVTIIVLTFIS